MADQGLTAALVAGAVLLTACSHGGAEQRDRGSPPASSAGPRQKRQSAEPPAQDPSRKPPAGYRRMAVGGITPTSEGNAVVLTDDGDRTGLVIFVGGTEALSIALRLEHRKVDRPLTHDLLDSVVRKLGGDLVSVRVDRLEDDVFYGSVLFTKDGRIVELDARPSDALALALGNSAPVYVAESVLEQAGVDIGKLDFRKIPGKDGKAKGPTGEVEL